MTRLTKNKKRPTPPQERKHDQTNSNCPVSLEFPNNSKSIMKQYVIDRYCVCSGTVTSQDVLDDMSVLFETLSTAALLDANNLKEIVIQQCMNYDKLVAHYKHDTH